MNVFCRTTFAKILLMCYVYVVMAIPEIPGVVNFVPSELRESFSSLLPIRGMLEQYKAYSAGWTRGNIPDAEQLHSDVRHFMPVIERAVEAGGLLMSRACLTMIKIRQDEVNDIANESADWHIDGPNNYYRRVVVSDFYGPQYRTRSGEINTTPNYGMLLIDDGTLHTARRAPAGTVRTRLQITQV